ncbi:MAG TPA: hypothetical protein VMT62_09500 [Syntrophorhabdaceae bacterium]|nr:hypothetical protein [Syntrophorhabdaceae bacterium]
MARYQRRKEIEATQWFPGVAITDVRESTGCAFLENGTRVMPGQYVVRTGKMVAVLSEESFCIIFDAEPAMKKDARDRWPEPDVKEGQRG